MISIIIIHLSPLSRVKSSRQQTARFFDSFFPKVSVDNFHRIDILQSLGGGVDISPFSGKKAASEENFREI
jgi:hypothetical protein